MRKPIKPTHKQIRHYLKDKIATDFRFTLKCLQIVYNNQTQYEKGEERRVNEKENYIDVEKHETVTVDLNQKGFSKCDASFGGDIAFKYLQGGKTVFTPKQVKVLQGMMPKYWRQFYESDLVDKSMLHEQILATL